MINTLTTKLNWESNEAHCLNDKDIRHGAENNIISQTTIVNLFNQIVSSISTNQPANNMAAVLYWQALPVGTMSFKGPEETSLNLSKVA